MSNATIHALGLPGQLLLLHIPASEAGLGGPDATVISESPHKSATGCTWSLEPSIPEPGTSSKRASTLESSVLARS